MRKEWQRAVKTLTILAKRGTKVWKQQTGRHRHCMMSFSAIAGRNGRSVKIAFLALFTPVLYQTDRMMVKMTHYSPFGSWKKILNKSDFTKLHDMFFLSSWSPFCKTLSWRKTKNPSKAFLSCLSVCLIQTQQAICNWDNFIYLDSSLECPKYLGDSVNLTVCPTTGSSSVNQQGQVCSAVDQ